MVTQISTQQIFRFIVVGSAAAAVHIGCVYLGVRSFILAPLWANIFAFLMAFTVSYFGHQYWTFAAAQARFSVSWYRFLFIAMMGFVLNEGLLYLLLTAFHLYYLIALPIVLLIVPPFTFVWSKVWAFKAS